MDYDKQLEKFMHDVDALTDEEAEPDYYNGELDESKWAKYQDMVGRLLLLAEQDKAILEMKYLKEPNRYDPGATVTVKFPIAFLLADNTKDRIADTVRECDYFSVTSISGNIRMNFSIRNIWSDS